MLVHAGRGRGLQKSLKMFAAGWVMGLLYCVVRLWGGESER